jgi:hypothetical protein
MTIIPNSEVRLCSNVPLTNSYEHTMTFADPSAQANYFLSKVSHAFTGLTYQRETLAVRVPASYDSLYNCNYLMYRNNDFGTKWFYAFITEREYVNPEMTLVHFELDVYQTWQFAVNWNMSFVEREHRDRWNTDGTPVINTLDEGLNYGTEYNTVSVSHFRPYSDLYFLVTISKKNMHNDANADTNGYVWSLNGLPQALCFYIHPFRLDGSVPASNLSLNEQIGDVLLSMYESTDAVNNIVSMYVTNFLPDQPLYDGTTITFNTNYYKQATIGSLNTIYVHSVNYQTGIFDMGGKYDGFTQETESKLMMYPYKVTVLTDFKGNQVELKNEYINNENLLLDVNGSLGVSNKVSYSVKDYVTTITEDTFKDAISLGHGLIDNNPNDIPVLTDLLAAYIQGNRNSIQNQTNSILFNGVFGSLGNALTKNPLGFIQGAGNALFQMQAINAKQEDIKNTPPAMAKMGSNTYYDYGNGYTGLWIIKKEITPEYRKKLEDFFKMYGYKMNEVKIPNLHSREHFNFVKTIGANIYGDIPNQDLEKIRSMFNNGVTLWHGDWVGNYALANSEV